MEFLRLFEVSDPVRDRAMEYGNAWAQKATHIFKKGEKRKVLPVEGTQESSFFHTWLQNILHEVDTSLDIDLSGRLPNGARATRMLRTWWRMQKRKGYFNPPHSQDKIFIDNLSYVVYHSERIIRDLNMVLKGNLQWVLSRDPIDMVSCSTDRGWETCWGTGQDDFVEGELLRFIKCSPF